ncbi:MAG: 2Fe-2S iron-sulfur cluster-binding protein, partial [Acetobacteraceae bacterium]
MTGVHTRETLLLEIWRGDADGELRTYQIPMRERETVLDAVSEVQCTQDPTLAYRFACRVGMCGSCAMTVNGKAAWTCRTHVAKVAGAGGEIE